MTAQDLAAAYGGRTVLVTGHTGFKGSWLCLWLARLGARVVGYGLGPTTEPHNFGAAGVADDLSAQHEGDVRDAVLVADVVSRSRPDLVLHLAAQSLVPLSYARPLDTFSTNVMGTANVLDAIRQAARPCAAVVVSSDKCYENVSQVWGYREGDALGGSDPYSASKAATEIVASAYRRSFFPPGRAADHGVLLGSARAGNVVGGGDWSAHRLVPDAIRALVAGRVLGLRSPSSVRPWQHVLEPLSGYLVVGARLLAGDTSACTAFNFGPVPGEEAPVQTLVEDLFAAWGSGRWEQLPAEGQPGEAHLLRLGIDKARVELGWRPRWGRAETVGRTVAWYRRYADDPGTARRSCLEDIAAYEAAMTPDDGQSDEGTPEEGQ